MTESTGDIREKTSDGTEEAGRTAKERGADQAVLQRDLDEIYIGNLNTVDADLTLPSRGRNGSEFTWESKEILFISHEGKVTRPSHGVGNRRVVLEVRAAYGSARGSRSFEATVLEAPRKIEAAEIRAVEAEAEPGSAVQLPPVVIALEKNGDAVTLPVSWEDFSPLETEGTLSVQGTVEEIQARAQARIHFRRGKGDAPAACREKLAAFAPGSVTLKEGSPFAKAQERMIDFLKHTDDDQMLYNFRAAAGLDTKGAAPMTGWDAPNCNLKGHTTGHYLSGLALAYAASGDARLKEKLDYMTESLAQCQRGLEKKGWRRGFLSAYGEEQFDLLERYTTYPTIWAPYYTLDKIMSGLYDCYTLGGNETAFTLLKGIGEWVYQRLSALPRVQRERMWSMYIAGEYGGMIGSMVRLYQLTGEPHYLEAAGYFGNEKLFYPMAEGVDTLKDMHANQHIPQIIGALELYKAGKGERYLAIAQNFWNMVTEAHTYTIGGTGETEMFRAPGHLADYLTDKCAESCASYNMLRLTSGLFCLRPAGAMMDYYENTLYNHLLSSMSRVSDGGTTYFMPLRPGGHKEFGTDENTCCHGTGLESRFRYMSDIYMGGGDALYINLYIPSELRANGIYADQTAGEGGSIRFVLESERELDTAFRVPGWAEKFSVTVNGKRFEKVQEDGYVHISRQWSREDRVEAEASCGFREIASPDRADYKSVAWGPYILAELCREERFQTPPCLARAQLRREGGYLTVTAEGRRFRPLAEISDEPYHVYFREESASKGK